MSSAPTSTSRGSKRRSFLQSCARCGNCFSDCCQDPPAELPASRIPLSPIRQSSINEAHKPPPSQLPSKPWAGTSHTAASSGSAQATGGHSSAATDRLPIGSARSLNYIQKGQIFGDEGYAGPIKPPVSRTPSPTVLRARVPVGVQGRFGGTSSTAASERTARNETRTQETGVSGAEGSRRSTTQQSEREESPVLGAFSGNSSDTASSG